MRPLVVVGALPFQITARGIDRSSLPLRSFRRGGGGHDPPLAGFFLGGDTPGKVNTRIRIQTTASAEPLEAEVSINLTPPAGAETADQRPAESKPEQGKPEKGWSIRCLVPPARPPSRDLPLTGVLVHEAVTAACLRSH